MRLTGNFLGITHTRIDYMAEGRSRSVAIPEIMDFRVEGITAGRNTEPIWLENTAHPVNSSVALARGIHNTYADHGLRWDNTGKNGHYSAFEWRSP